MCHLPEAYNAPLDSLEKKEILSALEDACVAAQADQVYVRFFFNFKKNLCVFFSMRGFRVYGFSFFFLCVFFSLCVFLLTKSTCSVCEPTVVSLSMSLSMSPCVSLPMCVPFYVPLCVHLYVPLCVPPCVCPFLCPPVCPSLCPPVSLSLYPRVCLLVYQSNPHLQCLYFI